MAILYGDSIGVKEKSIQFKAAADGKEFWIPKSQIVVTGDGWIEVSDWWLSRIQDSTPTPKQLAHRAGCCHLCGHPYTAHPLAPQGKYPAPYLVLCDGVEFNTKIQKKVTRHHFHSPEWKAYAEQVRVYMMSKPGGSDE